MKRVLSGPMVLGLLVLLMPALLMLSGCSSMKVTTDWSESADFDRFETFIYKDSDQNLSSANPLNHRRVIDAINREMVAEGFVEVDENPDVFVTYYAGIDEQIVLNSTSTGYSHGSRWHRGGVGMGSTTTTSSTVRTGTLVIDMLDAPANELIWRGRVSDTLNSNPDQVTDSINRGIARVFEQFPPN